MKKTIALSPILLLAFFAFKPSGEKVVKLTLSALSIDKITITELRLYGVVS